MKHVVSSLVYLVALLCLSVFVFDPTNMYYELPWLDIPVHIMGGFGVASLTLALASYANKKLSLAMLMSVYILVALGWELYEITKDLTTGSTLNGWSDTIYDVINGAIGSIGAYYLLKK